VKTMLSMAKTASELVTARREVTELRVKLAAAEKRAAAESFLIELMNDPAAPVHFRPSGVDDFLAKRAQVEKIDLNQARLATKIASRGSFEIGEPEDEKPRFSASGSKADDEFTDWLTGFGAS
jgi:hypothetical protein